MAKKSPVQGKKRGAPTNSRAQKQAAKYSQMTQQASQQTLSKPKSTKAAKPKASVGGGSVRAQKQAAKYSQMTQQASKKTLAKKPSLSIGNRQVPPSAPSRPVSIGPSDPKASRLQTKLVKSKFSMNSRKKALAENIIASKKARQAAGTGFASFNAKAQAIESASKVQPKAKKKTASKKAGKVSAGKSTGSGKRTRSFSEGKIKRDSIGRFASKGSSARK